MDKKVTSNFFYNMAYQILCILTPLVTTPYVARVLGSEGVGIYSYTSTMALTFALFAALGANTYGQREIAMRQNDVYGRSKVFWEVAILRCITTLVATVAYLVLCFTYSDYQIYLLQSIFIVLAIMVDMCWMYMGMEDFRITVTNNIMVKLATIVCIFLFVREQDDVGIYILINSISSIASSVYFVLHLPKYIMPVPLKELKIWRHMPGVIQFFIPIISVQIFSQVDKLMLGAMITDISENGYYEQARKLTNLVVVITTALNTVLLPRLSNLFAGEKKSEMIKTYRETFHMTLMLLIPIAVGLFVISDNFVIWFLGHGFAKTALLLKWSCPLIILMTIGNFVGLQYLSPTGRQNTMTKVYIFAAVVNVVLNSLLIPRLMSEGAMIASVAAEACSCFLQIHLLKRSEYNFKMLDGAWKYVVAAGCMAIAILCVNGLTGISGVLETVVDIAVGAMVYFVALVFLREENLVMVIKKVASKVNK